VFDQEVTIQNLRNIILMENRKGNYLVSKFMPEITRLDKRIDTLLIYRKKIQGSIKSDTNESIIKRTDELIVKIRDKRDAEIDQHLNKIISKITDKNYNITIYRKDLIGNKPIFIIDDEPESYFAIKHLQYCLRKLYKVKQSNRSEIVSQLAGIIDDNFPKFIYHTDVENFYESIPEAALNHIRQENLLSRFNKRLLIQVMDQYYSLSGSRLGVPRGIGVSAYIVEIYMREFDRSVSRLEDLVFYRRYVDDMIFVFVPRSLCNISTYEAQIDKVFNYYLLKKNKSKSKAYVLTNPTDESRSYKFDFLGYSFHFNGKSLTIDLSDHKFELILARMNAAFEEYVANKASNKRKEDRRLFKRLSYLAGNTKLQNRKSNILIGIYFSNTLVNSFTRLKNLDCELKNRLNKLQLSDTLRNRFKSLSFENGFKEKKFTILTQDDLEKISECWNGIK
jgi:hypothetical protein